MNETLCIITLINSQAGFGMVSDGFCPFPSRQLLNEINTGPLERIHEN